MLIELVAWTTALALLPIGLDLLLRLAPRRGRATRAHAAAAPAVATFAQASPPPSFAAEVFTASLLEDGANSVPASFASFTIAS
jgi:hypothetical protein